MSMSFRRAPIVAALIASALAVAPALAAEHAKSAAKPAAKPQPVKTAFAVPDAQPDQVKAAELVFYGSYDCEFQQSVSVAQSAKYPAYVDVKFANATWLMKPVLSSTGAIRLEDTRGETLMVQIASKSMLLNVKAGKRLVDECICPKQPPRVGGAGGRRTGPRHGVARSVPHARHGGHAVPPPPRRAAANAG